MMFLGHKVNSTGLHPAGATSKENLKKCFLVTSIN